MKTTFLAARQAVTTAEAAIISAPENTSAEKAGELFAALRAAKAALSAAGHAVVEAINAGLVPADEFLSASMAGEVGRKISRLEPGQFRPHIGVTWGPFTDGRSFETGVVAGTRGASVVMAVGFDGRQFTLMQQCIGDYADAERLNGHIRLV